jgi:hypothetical protein
MALTYGRCVECGAMMTLHRPHGSLAGHVAHEPDCPGHVDVIAAVIARWEQADQ